MFKLSPERLYYPQNMTNAKGAIDHNSCSRLHPIAVHLIELIPGCSELLRDDVAQIHQVVETFLQSL